MKRYGIYLTVILIFLSGSFFNGFSQDNSNIESIIKTYPIKDTIFDPAVDSIIIQVELDSYFIWENTPPDSIGFFSFNNNYSWVEKDVTNTTLFQPEYKSVSPVYNFNEEVNQVCFWLYDQNDGHNFDLTTCFNIVYNKPQVELLDVDPADQVPGEPVYVVYESNPMLKVNAESWFPSNDVNSFITKIELKDISTSFYYTLWENASGVAQKEIEVALPVEFTLNPGSTRSFALRAVGRTATGYSGPVETSEEFPFSLVYMYTNFTDTICQVNSLISLEALPEGGSFEGKGIVDNTNLFNPSLADANTYNTVTYKLIIDGSEFSVSEAIYVIDLPAVELDGELEVCANSTDVKYTILNAETSKYDYVWKFTGVAEILDSTDVSVTVHWQANPASYTGMIRISLEGKNQTQCPASFEYLVDIDPDAAPDKPCVCFGDISRNLLLCSNTTASYYEWWVEDSDLAGTSETPYFYLTEDIKKDHNIDNSTLFTVRISNQLTGCYTTGYMCEEQTCAGAEQSSLPTMGENEGLTVAILDNPVHNDLNLKTSGTYSGRFEIKIYSMSGSLVFTSQGIKAFPAEELRIALDPEMKRGMYLVVAQYGSNRTAPVKMIVY
jgi:hypothetical protein